MSSIDHQQGVTVEQAAQWLSQQMEPAIPVVTALRSQFNLSPTEACEACALAAQYPTNRRAFG